MPGIRKIKAIIDTNLFVSFLIGKRLHGLKTLMTDSRNELIFAKQNIQELRLVSLRPKFNKYFKSDDLEDLINLLETIGKVFEILDAPDVCRDPKDDYLLELAKRSRADYLVTGDKDLLEIETYGSTRIVTASEFTLLIAL
ncbi:MAG: putative toxin-antitoxin system toxin component, PIN family [Mangrovibacterium sp.]